MSEKTIHDNASSQYEWPQTEGYWRCLNCEHGIEGDDTCERVICDCCEACVGTFYEFGESKEHTLCSNCLNQLLVAFHTTQPITQPELESKTNISEKLVTVRKTITEQERNTIYERDNYQCVQCGSTERLEIDHIIPFSKGGTTESSNLQTLCKTCNGKKSNHFPTGS